MEYKFIGKDNQVNQSVVSMLNKILALYGTTSQNARAFHWNVQGPHFLEYHGIFEEIYKHLAEQMDEIAERTLAIGGKVLVKNSEYIEVSTILKNDLGVSVVEREYSDNMIEALCVDLEVLSYMLGEFIKEIEDDHVSQDLLIGEKGEIDKFLWKLRAINSKD